MSALRLLRPENHAEMHEGNLLEVRDLCVEFRQPRQGTLHAVRGASLRVRPGSVVALVGESGSGKSVVAQTIMGILPTSASVASGSVWLRDPDPLELTALGDDSPQRRAVRGGRISMIFQEPMTSLSPLHTIGDQIGEAARLHLAAADAEARERTCEMLDAVGFPDPLAALHRYPFELSGGLRQRAMIAMALICEPALLIADEPTTALDVTVQAQILDLLRSLQARFDMGILLITHDLGVVANMAEETVVMYHGEVMEAGPTDALLASPRHDYLKGLVRAIPRIGMARDERLQPLREIAPARSDTVRREPRSDDVMLEARGLSKTYGLRKGGMFGSGSQGFRALDNVSFELRRGECLGLVGESGSGKTTLSKLLLRALEPDEGASLRFNPAGGDGWQDVLALSGDALQAFRRNAQFVFQDPVSSLNPRMTVLRLVTEPMVIHNIGNAASRAARAAELMERVGLDPRYLARFTHSFSGGQRQRIGVARALALDPTLLLLDEPVSALDVSVQAQVLNLLKDLQAELGLTYLFVSHNLAVVDYVADRIAVMCRGMLVEVAPREALFDSPAHPYTRALLAAVPSADPGARLDLGALMDGRASEPEEWPRPFRLEAGTVHSLHTVGDGHYVRACEPPAGNSQNN